MSESKAHQNAHEGRRGSARGAAALAIAGAIIGSGGMLHPRVDTTVPTEEGLAGMFESSVWVLSHSLALAGYLLLTAALAMLVRASAETWSPRLVRLGWVAVAAAGLAAVETVPHILAASEATALRQGEETTLVDIHLALQVIATPALGLSLAVLAVAGARSGMLDGGRFATGVAVVGGVAYALAGPVIALTDDSSLSPLFAGTAGLALWSTFTGARLFRAGRAGAARRGGLAQAAA